MLVVLGVAAAVDNVGAYHVPVRAYPALALLVVGAGLLVGAFWGRSRLLILLGLAILPFAFAASLVRVPIKGGTGDRLYTPQSVQGIRSEYRLAAGQIRLDLRQVPWGSEPVGVRLSTAAGNIEVLVPPQVTVNFRGHAGAGEIDFFDQVRNGIDVTLQSVDQGTAQGGPRLDLNADVSVGRISVVRPGQLGRVGDFPPLPPQPGAAASG